MELVDVQVQAPAPDVILEQHEMDFNGFPELLLPGSGPGPGYQHHMFFDPSANMEDTTADLEWLFGAAPIPVSNDVVTSSYGYPLPLDIPSASPNSTFSDQTSIDNATDPLDPWVTARARIFSALHGLPSDLLEDPFFEPANLRSFCEVYFANYNAHFPIIHRATMSVETAQPLLLVAMVTLGAGLSPNINNYRASERIHEHLRWLIFSSGSFQPPAPLWCLQALLLAQAYEKMASTRKHHELAHIFHGAVITLMRRGTSYSTEPIDGSAKESSVERAWHLWIEQESSKRVAYFAFIMDAQHASIFGHTPALSVSDLRLPLTYAEETWDATTASKWKRALSKHDEPLHFLPTLRSLLSRRPLPASCSPFSRFVLLHGLFSVMKYMQARDITAVDVAADRSSAELDGADSESLVTPHSSAEENWKEVLDRAIDTWSFSLLSQDPSLCLEAARPLHRIAHVIIHVSLVDFHTFVGAPSLVSSITTKDEYEKARTRLKAWSQTNGNTKRALSHCVLLIQETMFTRKRYRAAEDNIALRPWCLYHASLVLWTYGVMTEGLATTSRLGAEEYLVHMLSGLMGDPNELNDKNQTCGLLSTVRESLVGCRWQLLQEAHATLGRLIDMVQGPPAQPAQAG
jgi:hypothetical protein